MTTELARQLVAEAIARSVAEVPADGGIGIVPGWDSLAHMSLMLLLEARLARSLTAEEIVSIRTVADVGRIIHTGPQKF